MQTATRMPAKISSFDPIDSTHVTENGGVLNQFLQATSTGFALLDDNFNIIRCNEAYAKVRGKPEAFFAGKNCLDFYPTDAHQLLKKVKKSKQPSMVKARPLASPGNSQRNTSYWSWTIVPVLNQDSELETLILAETEMTESVLLEQELCQISGILTAIRHAQQPSNPDTEPEEILDTLLAEVINLTESQFGFIGEVFDTAEGRACFKMQSMFNLEQQDQAVTFSISPSPQYLNLTEGDSLVSSVVESGEAAIVTNPAGDIQITGLLDGHPVLTDLLVLPLNAGDGWKGALLVANSENGYDDSLARFLQPLVNSYLQLINLHELDKSRRELLGQLEENAALIRQMAIPAVENEHDELITLVNECYEEMAGCAEPERVKQLLDAMYSSVAAHFLHEEQLMRSAAYPEYVAHKQSHERLLEIFRKRIESYSEDPENTIQVLRDTLASWFGRHFSTHDQRLNKYFGG